MRPTGKVIVLEDAPPPPSNMGSPILCPPSRSVLALLRAKTPNTELAWLDRAGRRTSTIPLAPGRYEWPALSPDGKWAAVVKVYSATRSDLWMVDLERGLATPATFDSSGSAGGVWTPDGSRFAYQGNPSGDFDIYQVSAGGKGQPEPLVQSEAMFELPEAYSPDGKYFVFSTYGPTQWDLWLMPLKGQRTPVPYLCTPFNENMGDISPDGRWLAYASDESGRYEIYVRSFPEPGERYRVSTTGGYVARWSRDGKQLLFWTGGEPGNPAGQVLAADVETAPSFRVVGAPRLVFTPPPEVAGMAVPRDLEHWLAAVQVEKAEPPSITVILNWQEALKDALD
jgi:Tol biopolymer transport system component